jgi:cell division protein FtsB
VANDIGSSNTNNVDEKIAELKAENQELRQKMDKMNSVLTKLASDQAIGNDTILAIHQKICSID